MPKNKGQPPDVQMTLVAFSISSRPKFRLPVVLSAGLFLAVLVLF